MIFLICTHSESDSHSVSIYCAPEWDVCEAAAQMLGGGNWI